jgi:hypothetical protein
LLLPDGKEQRERNIRPESTGNVATWPLLYTHLCDNLLQYEELMEEKTTKAQNLENEVSILKEGQSKQVYVCNARLFVALLLFALVINADITYS